MRTAYRHSQQQACVGGHARLPLKCPIVRYLMVGSAVQNENIFRMDGIGTGEAAKVARYARAGKAWMTQAIRSEDPLEQETADPDVVLGRAPDKVYVDFAAQTALGRFVEESDVAGAVR